MLNDDDQYTERTPDLVAKVRKMRKIAEKEMNRFTRVADYDVHRVVGHGPKPVPAADETAAPAPARERPKKFGAKTDVAQISIEFTPAPAEDGDTEEEA
ncbi:MAG: hypothetical protein WA634_06360 [Silvibacterium sp.]